MSKNGTTRRERVIALRDRAVDVVRRHGKPDGNIDHDGQFTRIASFERRRYRIEYWSPLRPSGAGGDQYRVIIKFEFRKVFDVGWDGDWINVIRFERGEWEAPMIGRAT